MRFLFSKVKEKYDKYGLILPIKKSGFNPRLLYIFPVPEPLIEPIYLVRNLIDPSRPSHEQFADDDTQQRNQFLH